MIGAERTQAKPIQDIIYVDSIEEYTLPHNKVVLRMGEHPSQRRSDGGLFLCGDDDFEPAEHADRIGWVESIGKTFYDKEHPESLPWKTYNVLEIGDKVYFSYLEGLNCPIIKVRGDGNVYKLISYQDIYLSIRNGNINMINGYVLFTPVYKEVGWGEKKDKLIDPRYGIVAKMGVKNVEYVIEQYHDIDVEIGDKVHLDKNAASSLVFLESDNHLLLDGNKYFIKQRRSVALVL